MLTRLIDGLRRELRPLVRAEIEAEVEKRIRAERQSCIEQEILEELVASGKVAEQCRKILNHLRGEIEPQIKDSVRLQLEHALYVDVVAQIRAECEANIKEEFEELQNARKQRLLKESFTDDDFYSIRSKVEAELRRELDPFVREELRHALAQEVRSSIIQAVKDELKSSPLVNSEAKAELKRELADSVRSELREQLHGEVMEQLRSSMKDKVEGMLRAELTLPLVEMIASNSEGEVANALALGKHHMEKGLRSSLEKQLLFQVTTSFADWLWTQSGLPEDVIQKIISRVREDIGGETPETEISNIICVQIAGEERSCAFTERGISAGEYYLSVDNRICSLPRSHEEAKYFASLVVATDERLHATDPAPAPAQEHFNSDEFLKI